MLQQNTVAPRYINLICSKMYFIHQMYFILLALYSNNCNTFKGTNDKKINVSFYKKFWTSCHHHIFDEKCWLYSTLLIFFWYRCLLYCMLHRKHLSQLIIYQSFFIFFLSQEWLKSFFLSHYILLSQECTQKPLFLEFSLITYFADLIHSHLCSRNHYKHV